MKGPLLCAGPNLFLLNLFMFFVLFIQLPLIFAFFQVESANLDTENNNKPVIEEGETLEEEQVAVSSVSPLATNMASLYASEKFYSDDESDDDYKDFLPDFNPQSKSVFLRDVSFH